jgi:CheY-like chemotaxis protein
MTHILIVDDDAGLREATRSVLEDAGFLVTVAQGGDEAVRALHLQSAAVVLCDMFMPGKDGIETIRELRRDFPDVKIIGISGGGSRGTVDVLKLAQMLGASEVLHKPFTRHALLAAIDRLLAPPAYDSDIF